MNGTSAISGTYDIRLVFLSLGIAVLTSFAALDLAARVTANRGSARLAWLVGGSFAMGSGIWCIHYTGMLAFCLPVPVYYHIPTAILSILAAIVASAVALYVVSRERMTFAHAAIGGFLVGGAIATMHYTGMAAMRLQAMHVYDRGLRASSLLLAIALSVVGLLLIFHTREENRSWKRKAAIALSLGLVVPATHYIGMAAVSFVPASALPDLTHSIDISNLANLAILVITILVLGFALLTSLIDRRLSVYASTLDNERKMLRALIDNIPDTMYVKDIDSCFVLANPRTAQNMGAKSPQDLIGKSDFTFFPEELASRFYEEEQRIMQTGEGLFNHEEFMIDSEGNEVPLLTTKVPLRDSKGNITAIAGVGRDISERKKSEDALREAERKYRGIFDEAIVGIFQISPDGRLLDANLALAHIFGYGSPGEMTSAMTDTWRLSVDPKRQQDFSAVMETSGRVQNFECEVLREEGGTIWISATVRAILEEGSLIRYEGMIEDVTERKLLRDQLFQAQKLESVGQLAAGIAHEINTPIQYIGDNVRFLKETFFHLTGLLDAYGSLLETVRSEAPLAASVEKVLAAVEEADLPYLLDEAPRAFDQTLEGVTRVSTIVTAMKEFSHPGTREKIPLDLNHAIQSTITVARSEWKYVADMETDFDVNLPRVSCQPGEFNQVVLNLIVNAAHAIADVLQTDSESKGTIKVQTRDCPAWVEIRIGDTGPGIPAHVRGRIFDPFFTTKQIGKGTGQGLAIARSVIVDKHGGSIDFETIDGKGTTFLLRLPHDGTTLVPRVLAA